MGLDGSARRRDCARHAQLHAHRRLALHHPLAETLARGEGVSACTELTLYGICSDLRALQKMRARRL